MHDQQTGVLIPRFPATMKEIGNLTEGCARRIIHALSSPDVVPAKASIEDLEVLFIAVLSLPCISEH